ncbi:MAG: endonuclease/exonuclease/phosphatase family protein [Planctomycetaceae bacterium]
MTIFSPRSPAASPSTPRPFRTATPARHISHSSLFQVAVARLSWLNAVGVGLLWLLIFAVSERFWVGTALTYFPRWPWVLPSLALMLAGVLCHRKYAALNLISAAMVMGPISQYQFQLGEPASIPVNAKPLTVVTCNVQGYRQDFLQVIREIIRLDPDIIAFQEALPDNELVQKHFGKWHAVHRGEFWVGSRYPVHFVDECRSQAFDRRTAVCVTVDTPAGEVVLVNVHQMTARRSLNELKGRGIIDGKGPNRVERHALLRNDEASTTRDFVDHFANFKPTLVMGDLNMPTSSSIYRAHWGSFTNAYDAAGEGYGYSSPCSRFWWWPLETPWLRIDHILTSSHWTASRCNTGESTGSDHRLVSARLHLAATPQP